jgi:hypothetical protein
MAGRPGRPKKDNIARSNACLEEFLKRIESHAERLDLEEAATKSFINRIEILDARASAASQDIRVLEAKNERDKAISCEHSALHKVLQIAFAMALFIVVYKVICLGDDIVRHKLMYMYDVGCDLETKDLSAFLTE